MMIRDVTFLRKIVFQLGSKYDTDERYDKTRCSRKIECFIWVYILEPIWVETLWKKFFF